jgi:diguanylate cyclase (GGDEF)-like protein
MRGRFNSEPVRVNDRHSSGFARGLRPLTARLRQALPEGGSLPLQEWQRRHAGIMALLWLNVLAIPVYGLLAGRGSTVHDVDSGLALAVFAVLGATPRLSRKLRTAAASLGLLTAAALLIHQTGGLIEAHFYFFVLIIVLTLYEDWVPFLLAVAFVLIHHGVLGTLEPKSVFDRPEEWADPWKWAAIHAGFVAAAGVAALATWRLNENVRAEMRATHKQLAIASETDSLTGLGNRRKLIADLTAIAASGQAAVVVILDLDGFKAYNDSFGHPAGDSLLARIGARLQRATERPGRAYRMGGDEFCSIWLAEQAPRATVESVCAASICERGEGFSITAACGAVSMPDEASTAEMALQLADQRMYANKDGSRLSSGEQSRKVLLQALAEQRPELSPHVDAVMVLARDVAERLGLPAQTIEQVCQAAQLHDIGKIAIPAAILDKRGPLDEEEWSFMRRHTTIGERIVSAAPALAHVAPMVRSSHERWDGGGYPDGLAGERIPIGSRIVFVCDAFDAMTTDRAYRLAVSPQDAIAELRRCAGTQFDPEVVAAFEATLARREPAATGAPAAADRAGKQRTLPSSALRQETAKPMSAS